LDNRQGFPVSAAGQSECDVSCQLPGLDNRYSCHVAALTNRICFQSVRIKRSLYDPKRRIKKQVRTLKPSSKFKAFVETYTAEVVNVIKSNVDIDRGDTDIGVAIEDMC
jgi:hypothetical protein